MAGEMVHLEIPASDTGKAKEFWSSLFGWEWQQFEGPSEYHMTRFSETTGGAIYAAEQADNRGTARLLRRRRHQRGQRARQGARR